MTRRAAGILLHPTSLPGPFGVGDLGPAADRFLDWARDAGQSYWQVLPLGPPTLGDSPYTAFSAFAGNPLLISPELLAAEGLLESSDLDDRPGFAPVRIDYGQVKGWKEGLLRKSFARFRDNPTDALEAELEDFAERSDERFWLDDWALYSALKERFGGVAWTEWPSELVRREDGALSAARNELEDEIAYHRWVQFLFFRQWRRLRSEAARRGVAILGDLPFYVAGDSAEVWAHAELFDLDDDGQPLRVAGVPPDYFSDDGQLWGNPLYRWDRMAENGYRWWIERLAANLRLTDLVRIDHFRAFCDYWVVPAGETTAKNGRWVDGPGIGFFEAIRETLGELPLVAEDLGDIHEGVEELRRAIGLPGMRVLQFGFDPSDDHHVPHHHEPDAVVYTGTHDNDTAVGWYTGLDPRTRERFADYSGLGESGGRKKEPHWALIRLAYTSVADLAIVPVQDVLGLGREARMNTPGREGGNWVWRLAEGDLDPAAARRLHRLAELSGRLAEPADAPEP